MTDGRILAAACYSGMTARPIHGWTTKLAARHPAAYRITTRRESHHRWKSLSLVRRQSRQNPHPAAARRWPPGHARVRDATLPRWRKLGPFARGIEGHQSLVHVVEKIPGAASELIERRTEPAGVGKSARLGEDLGADVRIAHQVRMGIAIGVEAKEVKRLHRCARLADRASSPGPDFTSIPVDAQALSCARNVSVLRQAPGRAGKAPGAVAVDRRENCGHHASKDPCRENYPRMSQGLRAVRHARRRHWLRQAVVGAGSTSATSSPESSSTRRSGR